jgi:hypothetical protein
MGMGLKLYIMGDTTKIISQFKERIYTLKLNKPEDILIKQSLLDLIADSESGEENEDDTPESLIRVLVDEVHEAGYFPDSIGPADARSE